MLESLFCDLLNVCSWADCLTLCLNVLIAKIIVSTLQCFQEILKYIYQHKSLISWLLLLYQDTVVMVLLKWHFWYNKAILN